MKKLITAILLFTSVYSFSQDDGRIFPQGQVAVNSGYIFKNRVQYQQGTLQINGSAFVTINGQYIFRSGQGVGVEYTIMPTTIEFQPSENASVSSGFDYQKENLNIHFITAKGTQYFPASRVVQPFFDFGLGAAIYSIQHPDVNSKTYFLMTIGAGSEFRVAKMISLRIRGGVKMPMYTSGSGFYCGIGGYYGLNCGLTMGGSAIISHWNVGGGIAFDF